MNRSNWFFAQTVTDGELESSQDAVEDATRQVQYDMSFEGIAAGLVATEAGVPDLTVEVSAGVAYNSLGERCQHPTAVIVDISKDYQDNPTAITGGVGFEAILGVSIGFAREYSDDRIDGNDNPLFFLENEAVVYRVVKGGESNTPPAVSPPLEAGFVRVCDIRLVHGASAITNAYITPPGGTYAAIANARQDMFLASAGNLSVRANSAEEAVQQLLTLLDDHPAEEISVDASGAWHDGTTNPADNLQDRLDKVIDDLADDTGAGGSDKIGSGALTPWVGGRARPAGSIWDQLDAVGVDLGATAAGDDGMERVGGEARTSALSGGLTLPIGTAASQTQYLIDNLPQLGVTTKQEWAGEHEFNANVNLDGGVTVRSAATVTSAGSLTLALGSTTSINVSLEMSGSSAGIGWETGTLGNSDASLTANTRYRFTTAPTIDRSYTLPASATDGHEIEVIMTILSATADALFKRNGGTEIARIVGAGNGGAVKFQYHSAGGDWYVSSHTGDATLTLHS